MQDTALHLGHREDRAQNHLAAEEEGCPGLKITFAGLCPARSRAPMVPAELRLAAEGEHGHPGLYVASALPVCSRLRSFARRARPFRPVRR